ncbi:MAG: C-terminal binding protein, partial [Candidatus Omnitrophica bacterium]|nr:C-terminal binding protein [Candidatus Omnitrophota bacterium]
APVNSDVVEAMNRAKVIVRYGIGVDNVALDKAREKSIPVCNVPDYCVDEVADHTLAFILASTRQVFSNSQFVRSGKWGLAVPLASMKTLRDMTVGVIGFGRIGREVCQRLLSFKAKILVYDPGVSDEDVKESGFHPRNLSELLTQSDLVTLHCPSNAQTQRIMNRKTINQMKAGSILINLGRGDLVETEALIEALESGHLGGAALDVFDPEPIPKDSPLLRMDNVIVASHIASASVRAVRTLRETAANIVVRAIRGEPLPNIVNGVKA